MSGLDGRPEDEVLGMLGRPETANVMTEEGETHNEPTAPQYLVYPISWEDVLNVVTLISNDACLIDFGEAFEVANPPAELGIPQVYCSPEYTLDHEVGIGSDIWALGCTLFEIRLGRKLFNMMDDDPDEHLAEMASVIGKFPEPWWSTTWKRRKELFQDDVDGNGAVMELHNYEPGKFARCLDDCIGDGHAFNDKFELMNKNTPLSENEVGLLLDLLERLFKYDPKERISAKEVLEHAWFQL